MNGEEETIAELDQSDKAQVAAQVVAMIHALDGRRWAEVQRYFGARVEVDYTSLFGGKVESPSREELVGNWDKLLSPLAATQHLLGPVVVTGSERKARAECHVRGYHYLPRAASGPEWMVAGHYAIELEHSDGAWLITSMTLQAYYQTGNLKLLTES